jgi:hypothetical protein
MYKIAYIIPYFGKLPSNFSLWIQSCANNPDIDFFFVTDIKVITQLPQNVKVYQKTFKEMVAEVQRKIPEINISIPNPYRLCDFKPAFGLIFEDMLPLSHYDFWGYCDTDIVFGNIRNFLTAEVLNRYDKIGFLGHSTLFRNNERMKLLFKSALNGIKPYISCYSEGSPTNSFFDETVINELAKKARITSFDKAIFADISPAYWNFRLGYEHGQNSLSSDICVFTLESGNLYAHRIKDGKVMRSEFMYIHFLRRKMRLCTSVNSDLLIYPNRIIHFEHNLTMSMVRKLGRNSSIKYWLDFVARKWRYITPKKVRIYIKERIRTRKQIKQF